MSQIFRKPQHWSGCDIDDIQERMDHFNSLTPEERTRLLQGEFTNLNQQECFDNSSWTRRSNR